MRNLWIWLVLGMAVVAVGGCGEDEASTTAPRSDGERIGIALGSTDVTSVKCTGSEYAPGSDMPKGFEPKHAGSSSVVFEPSKSEKSTSSGLWMAKAPLYVKIGSDPIEVGVLKYEGQPRSRLQYAQGGEPNDQNTSTRVRFLPCGDEKPTWRGYPGAIISDADPACMTYVEKVVGDYPMVTAVPLNGKCS